MNLKDAYYLIFLILLPPLMLLYKRRIDKSIINVPLPTFNLNSIKTATIIQYLKKSFIFLALIFLLLAMARPQSGYIYKKNETKGIDIILAMDTSSSMKAEDFKPNRLEAAKKVALNFVNNRHHDRIGVVIFSKDAITLCPLTLDYNVVKNFIKSLESGIIEDGTAIGTAIAEGAGRLSRAKGKSKIIILLTDGINNSGNIDPLTAAKASALIGVKVYTIGVGSIGKVPYPVDDPIFGKRYVSVDISLDENILNNIAEITGGKYFRATNQKKLEDIYKEINKMEKSSFETRDFLRKRDIYTYFLIVGILFLIIHIFINEWLSMSIV